VPRVDFGQRGQKGTGAHSSATVGGPHALPRWRPAPELRRRPKNAAEALGRRRKRATRHRSARGWARSNESNEPRRSVVAALPELDGIGAGDEICGGGVRVKTGTATPGTAGNGSRRVRRVARQRARLRAQRSSTAAAAMAVATAAELRSAKRGAAATGIDRRRGEEGKEVWSSPGG
jgi:hypothetical protein